MQKRKIWQFPWAYLESFVIGTGFLISGFLIEFFTGGQGVKLPVFPFNLIIILLLVFFIPVIYKLKKDHFFIIWLSGVPAAIVSIVFLSLLILLMGFIPQNDTAGSILSKFGLTHIFRSWPYFFITFYLIIILGFTISKRLFTISKKSIGFLLNHIGLWIVICSASLGSSDTKRFYMYCYKDNPSWLGVSNSGEKVEMPFALQLEKFEIEEYPSNLVILNLVTGEILNDQKEKNKTFLNNQKNRIIQVTDWKIFINEYYEYAIWFNNSYKPIRQFGAAPAAKITAVNKLSGDTVSGWISTGSYREKSSILEIDSVTAFAMTIPSPKKYKSSFKLYAPDKEIKRITLEVNKPISFKGWSLYQVGFDEKQGRWSELSIIEAVKDPWLYVVYTGIYMLICGSIFLFWQGRKK